MGLIYIIHLPSGKKYIGQHNTENINKRKQSHLSAFNTFYKTKKNVGCIALYHAFQKYSIKKCIWVVLENNIPKEQLNEKEDDYILTLNTLSPNGYNLKLNNSNGSIIFSPETLERMSISQSKVFEENLHKYRKKHKELDGVPQFVTYFESGGIRGYRIHNHPNCSFKQFTDDIDNGIPVLELKEQMLNFLKQCEKTPYITTQQSKLIIGIPKGIQEQKPGKFLVCFSYNSIKYTKFFGVNTRDKNLMNAIEWMENKRECLKNSHVDKFDGNISKSNTGTKKGINIPKGILEKPTGYVVQFAFKKKKYSKTFSKSSNTKEDNLRLATEWMDNKKKEIKEEGSETK